MIKVQFELVDESVVGLTPNCGAAGGCVGVGVGTIQFQVTVTVFGPAKTMLVVAGHETLGMVMVSWMCAPAPSNAPGSGLKVTPLIFVLLVDHSRKPCPCCVTVTVQTKEPPDACGQFEPPSRLLTLTASVGAAHVQGTVTVLAVPVNVSVSFILLFVQEPCDVVAIVIVTGVLPPGAIEPLAGLKVTMKPVNALFEAVQFSEDDALGALCRVVLQLQ